ncbi:unnamed protein product [Adineta ricciae]|uniref:Alanine racemase C-terminal domain-containing protein n=1 Tax=Adineta ricciae TaxID=249248 RepID=A0A815F9W8_ADIRI|nr:unnamed protein product [Adineta ricciae]CAF1357898.1 unnamed protein product [Adineta ricciae]
MRPLCTRLIDTDECSCPSTMYIDFNAMRHNLEKFQNVLSSTTKIMMMVKASAYGAGIEQISQWAENTGKIDYLGVVYAVEGVKLRKAGVTLPVMVINIYGIDIDFETCRMYNLEPVIYSISLLKQLVHWLKENDQGTFPNLHIKMNTGMNRLGLEFEELPELLAILSDCFCCSLTVKSIYSHAAASDDPQEDRYTNEQANLFISSASAMEQGLGYPLLKHICNSMGTLRHPQFHFDMVRIGGGLYGAATCFLPYLAPLLTAISLTSTITQVRRVKKGSTIGYNRRGLVNRDSLIGIISIGYADGLKRHLGNGHGHVWIHNCRVPFIGSICMDYAMIDLTDVSVENEHELQNESVEIFGHHINIEEVAKQCDTIVFEFISTIGQRVRRVYINENQSTNLTSPGDPVV